MKGGGGGGGSRERLTAFVPTSDCRFNCHGMIYVSEGKLIVSCWRPLCSVAPLFLSRAGGAIAPPPPPPPAPPPGHHATGYGGNKTRNLLVIRNAICSRPHPITQSIIQLAVKSSHMSRIGGGGGVALTIDRCINHTCAIVWLLK